MLKTRREEILFQIESDSIQIKTLSKRFTLGFNSLPDTILCQLPRGLSPSIRELK